MKLILMFLLFIALAYYIWTIKEGFEEDFEEGFEEDFEEGFEEDFEEGFEEDFEEGFEEDFEEGFEDNKNLTTNAVSPGITTIDRYQDPVCKADEYIYCVDGIIECDDILGGKLNTLSSLSKYESGDTLTGCSSFINKVNLSDYKDTTKGVGNTRAVYFDLSMCSSDKPWRMGGPTYKKVDGIWESTPNKIIPVSTCYDNELDAANAYDATTGKTIIFKKGDKVFVNGTFVGLDQTFLTLSDLDKTYYKIINNKKYYKAVITDATTANYEITYGPIGNQKTTTVNINSNGSVLIKDSLFNIYSNDYYSDLTTGTHPRPKCKGGVFTSCSSKPPFTISNGVYVPTMDSMDVSYTQQESELIKTQGQDVFNNTNPSGIIDKSNILEYNYFDTQLVSNPFIKCIADNGTNIGENVCCGQDDTLKNTKYICPQEVPNCKGYSKDENIYGICT
uniref:Uncharacterized protein n=1 Tax=viral metagenome TaxID=1070528 RepID=A0A6C0ETX1_9ZZZZ